ncbi:MAG TPA: sugar ABC transporter permease [Acetobacteraceae bacterium]|jgi:multiple sugar transport system permease protein|nr:sugar ABC transporter permease [Acetobacteraceae bacterium]
MIARTDRLPRWLTLAPALVMFGGLTVFPLVELVELSLNDVTYRNGVAEWRWTGLAHYADALQDGLFRAGIGNTLIFAVAAVSMQMVLGFGLALLTSRVVRGQGLYRSVFILPILVPAIVIGAMWKLMLNGDFGIVNQLTDLLGIAPRDWLGEKSTALLSVIVVDIWHWTPFCFLLLLAGLESMPRDVFEAAQIDGARWWSELRHVTLPLMAPMIAVTLLFRLILAFKVFDEVFLLTSGGPGTSTEVVSLTIFRRFFNEGRTGHGAALSIITMLAIVVLVLAAASRVMRRGRPA